MDDDVKQRLAAIEAKQDAQAGQLTRLEVIQDAMRATQADIKGTLGQVMSLLMAMSSDVSEIKGKIADMPTARDFGHLEGRVDELSARLPVTLAYQAPGQR